MKLTRKIKVGKFTCHWTLLTGSDKLKCEAAWTPRVPLKHEMTDQMMADYRKGRSEFMADVADKIGGSVGVVEV